MAEKTQEQKDRKTAAKVQRDNALAELRTLILSMTKAQQDGVKLLLTWHQDQQTGDDALHLKKTGQVLKAAYQEFVA